MKEQAKLVWGETPWDELSRDDLLREVQRMYAAVVALNTTAALCRNLEEGSPFWGTTGTGGRGLEHARQILEPLHAKYTSEQIFRSFFRYAVDLLFENLGSQWAVCEQCGQMLGTINGQPSKIGQPCAPPFGCGNGVMRKLEWKDLQSSAQTNRRRTAMTYNVKVEPVPDNHEYRSRDEYRSRLVITDTSGEREYWDGGEPEDNSFGRDWNWIEGELLAAYEQGKRDGGEDL